MGSSRDIMFSDQFVFTNKSPIVTIQLHPSDYELTLKKLLIYYGDRHSAHPVFYWNNGYNNLVKLSLEKQKLRYNPIPNDRPYHNPLSLIPVQKLPGLYIFDNLLDFAFLSPAEKSVRESQIYNCVNRLSHQSKVQVVLLGEWIQLSPKLRLKLDQIQLSLPTGQDISKTLEAELKQKPTVKLISACQGLSWGDIYHELANSESVSDLESLAQELLITA
mgnify:CR=1 FL=1